MEHDIDKIEEKLKNQVVTISAYEVGNIITNELHRIVTHSIADQSDLILVAMTTKLLASFGAAIMTEMFSSTDDDTIEIEPNNK